MQSKASHECIKCTTLRAPRLLPYSNMYIGMMRIRQQRRIVDPLLLPFPRKYRFVRGPISYDSGRKRPSRGLRKVPTMSAVCTISELSMISFLFYHS